ncbi:MAG: [protein-PII] uridylyltransferase [Acidobacteriota bacterium]|nr:[protein-PII] uridylyltransferase [Acidobacteriota bacterium]
MPETDPARLADLRVSHFSRLKSNFAATGDGPGFLREHAALADSILTQLWREILLAHAESGQGREGLCLAAIGGYGRAEMFPFSDIDLLVIAPDERALNNIKEDLATFARTLWDLQFRVSQTARTIADCGCFDAANLEFSIALLDIRFIAGARDLFDEVYSAVIPRLVRRDGQDLIRLLLDRTAERHARHGKTIFHLEPDVKDAPGGLRDFQTARWLERIQGTLDGKTAAPVNPVRAPGESRPAEEAAEFLRTVRCFLHFERGRNDNLLTYELHEKAASLGLGADYGKPLEPAVWMKLYYRRVRQIQALASRAVDDVRPSSSSLYGLFQDWRSRLSNADFAVVRGKIYPRSQGLADWPLLLALFEMMARHSLSLSREAGRWAEQSLNALMPHSGRAGTNAVEVWPSLRKILSLPGAAEALRAMHGLGLLTALIPEFQVIDSLIVRDYYHRYTVDEHTFTAIQALGDLKGEIRKVSSGDNEGLAPWRRKFGEIFAEVEQPALLALALLLHDVGKGMAAAEHVEGSAEAAKTVCDRLGLDSADANMVLFLVGSHLEMYSTISRRDIFDPSTLQAFAGKIAAPERLKMLCLMTYADISAVNPEAMTPWKAEMLWQLFAMTMNYFRHSVDQDRLSPASIAPGKAVAGERQPGELGAFLAGFPRRYLAAHSPSEIDQHFAWAQQIRQHPVTASVRRHEAYGELTVLATDRPALFVSVSGTLAAWGMNILKAEAYSNSSGIVLDVFRFHDAHRTLEMNPTEIQRLEKSVEQVLSGQASLAALMSGRLQTRGRRSKVEIPTQVGFDGVSSSRCTILELVAEDRPGLLYQVSAALAARGCNIEVALVETEGQKALDVFYLTANGGKLDPDLQSRVGEDLLLALSRC